MDFHIFNLIFNLEKQQLDDIDLYLSVGIKQLPGLKIGTINRTEIDNQFKDEINKTIQENIANQEKEFSSLTDNFLTGSNSEMKSKTLNQLLTALFSIASKK